MSTSALHEAAYLLHGVYDRLAPTAELSAPNELATKVALVAWLVTPEPPPATLRPTSGDPSTDLAAALEILVDRVNHDDLPIDTLVTARRWLHELVAADPPMATP
jgi:hypothetical protein